MNVKSWTLWELGQIEDKDEGQCIYYGKSSTRNN
jgi:hypothetical protein